MKLPPIEYFYGNTPFNNWARTCKPFDLKNKETTRTIMWIDLRQSPALVQIQEEMLMAEEWITQKFYEVNELLKHDIT